MLWRPAPARPAEAYPRAVSWSAWAGTPPPCQRAVVPPDRPTCRPCCRARATTAGQRAGRAARPARHHTLPTWWPGGPPRERARRPTGGPSSRRTEKQSDEHDHLCPHGGADRRARPPHGATLAAGEYDRFLTLLRSSPPEDGPAPPTAPAGTSGPWRPRPRPGRDGRLGAPAGHGPGAARAGGDVDAVTAHQVQAFAGLSRTNWSDASRRSLPERPAGAASPRSWAGTRTEGSHDSPSGGPRDMVESLDPGHLVHRVDSPAPPPHPRSRADVVAERSRPPRAALRLRLTGPAGAPGREHRRGGLELDLGAAGSVTVHVSPVGLPATRSDRYRRLAW